MHRGARMLPCRIVYFLKRFSKADRASCGREAEYECSFCAAVGAAGAIGAVSFSTVIRISNSLQLFLELFFNIGSGIGCVHSHWAPVSKWTHCLQQCNSNPHFGHAPFGLNPGPRMLPQLEHLACSTVPTMRGVRGPICSCRAGRG